MTRDEIDQCIRNIVKTTGIRVKSDYGSDEYAEFLDYLVSRGVQNEKEVLVILLGGLTLE